MMLGDELMLRLIEVGEHGEGWEVRSHGNNNNVYVRLFVPAEAGRLERQNRFAYAISDAIDQFARGFK